MEFLEVVQKRHSVRKYQSKKVEIEKINHILNCMFQAPSAGDLKAWTVLTVVEQELKDRIVKWAYGQDFLAQAPIVFVIFSNPDASASKYGQRGREFYCVQDATIAASYAQLAATNIGLSTCWVGAFDEIGLREELNVKNNLRPIALMALGYEEI